MRVRLLITALVVVATAGASVTTYTVLTRAHERHLRTALSAQKHFCIRQRIILGLTLASFELRPQPNQLLGIANSFRLHGILELCAPGEKMYGSEEDWCWIKDGKDECYVPYVKALYTVMDRHH